jgi:CIC family chloride channel protein
MFNRDLYDNTFVKDLMHKAPEVIFYEKDHFPDIMQKFKETAAWNLPVVKDDKYLGFISKSKLLSVYRRKLLELTSE